MTPFGFLLCIGLGALTVALAAPALRLGRWGALAIYAVVVAAGALTIPLVTAINFGPAGLAAVSRSAMGLLYPASAIICGGALWLMLRRHVSSMASSAESQHPGLVAEALSLHIASWFIAFDIGKIAHDAEMRQFFAASHLPLWSMYLVLAVEITGSIGLCVSKSRIASALVLSLIMIGAIGTHVRNGDPLSDSMDAVRILLLLLCVCGYMWRGWRA